MAAGLARTSVKDGNLLVVGAFGAAVDLDRHLGALGVRHGQLHPRQLSRDAEKLRHRRFGLCRGELLPHTSKKATSYLGSVFLPFEDVVRPF